MNDKKAQTRERILKAASSALITRGPIEPSVSEVMGAAGLTVGGFYAHFESKDAMMLEVFNQLLSCRRDALDAISGDSQEKSVVDCWPRFTCPVNTGMPLSRRVHCHPPC